MEDFQVDTPSFAVTGREAQPFFTAEIFFLISADSSCGIYANLHAGMPGYTTTADSKEKLFFRRFC